MFDQILFAVDDSEHALHAAKTAGDLARAVHTKELRIIAAYEPVPAYLGEPNLQNTISRRKAQSVKSLPKFKLIRLRVRSWKRS